MERGFQIVNGNMRRMALQPSRRRAASTTATTTNANNGAENGEGIAADDVAAGERALLAPALAMTNPATLMPNPKSLHDLWTEYLHGVGGRKPARLFSETERGRVKYKYTRRKVIWDVVRDLVSLGHTSHRAIDMIYNVYGPQTSVTDIINRLRRDKRSGNLNPNLRI
jgi:Transcriptional activator of glycolytic enzymes